MVDFGQFDVVVCLALAYPIYRHSEDSHQRPISKIGLNEDPILIFDERVAMVVPLPVLQYHGQTSHFGCNFYPFFHLRIYLDTITSCRLVHALLCLLWLYGSEKWPWEDRNGQSHGQFGLVGPFSVFGQKLAMVVRIKIKIGFKLRKE
jgi:hypothetical protein